jgi:hypothetical protein
MVRDTQPTRRRDDNYSGAIEPQAAAFLEFLQGSHCLSCSDDFMTYAVSLRLHDVADRLMADELIWLAPTDRGFNGYQCGLTGKGKELARSMAPRLAPSRLRSAHEVLEPESVAVRP